MPGTVRTSDARSRRLAYGPVATRLLAHGYAPPRALATGTTPLHLPVGARAGLRVDFGFAAGLACRERRLPTATRRRAAMTGAQLCAFLAISRHFSLLRVEVGGLAPRLDKEMPDGCFRRT